MAGTPCVVCQELGKAQPAWATKATRETDRPTCYAHSDPAAFSRGGVEGRLNPSPPADEDEVDLRNLGIEGLKRLAADKRTPPHVLRAVYAELIDASKGEGSASRSMSNSSIRHLAEWAALRVPAEYLEEVADAAGFDLVAREEESDDA